MLNEDPSFERKLKIDLMIEYLASHYAQDLEDMDYYELEELYQQRVNDDV